MSISEQRSDGTAQGAIRIFRDGNKGKQGFRLMVRDLLNTAIFFPYIELPLFNLSMLKIEGVQPLRPSSRDEPQVGSSNCLHLIEDDDFFINRSQ